LYVLEVVEKGGTLGEELSALGELMMFPQLGDQDWMIEVALHMVMIQLTHEELEEMHVPTEMAEFHEGLLDGTQDCYDSVDYVASGIDNLNPGDLERSVVLMNSCGAKISKLPAVIEEYMAQFE
jgi:hypothetical protein